MQAETYTPTGNIASEGMRNQLGRPRIDRLALLVREAAQNSWDAKAPEESTATFGIAGWTLSQEQLELLRDFVFAERPPSHAKESASLEQTIRQISALLSEGTSDSNAVRMLSVYDRGTTGLGGPTRANRLGNDDEPRDFVDFFRNVGTPPDKAQGGGTFGYGKAALYLASAAHTILVHSRIKNGEGHHDSRFMGSGLTNHYRHRSRLYTGRHWWGRENANDGIVDPVLNAEADAFAASLGLPECRGGARGTTVGIVAPDFGAWAHRPEEALRYLSWQLVLNFWPKMVPWPGEAEPRMKFEVSWEGKQIEIPDPANAPPFSGFVEALTEVRQAEIEGSRSHELYCLRPKRLLGRLALRKCYTKKTELSKFSEEGTVPDIHTRSHHVALLRRPELVVEYRSFAALASDTIGYAGVFLADEGMDRVYAAAEPPTHDSWTADILSDRHYRTFIRTTFKRIDEAVRDFVGPTTVATLAGEGGPLARFADHLGTVLIGVEGPGARIQPIESKPPRKPGRRPRRTARPNVSVSDTGRILLDESMRVRLFEVEVQHAVGTSATRLDVEIGIALLGGGLEREPPVGAALPEVAFWRKPNGERVSGDARKEATEEGTWELGVQVPSDAAVAVAVSGKSRGAT